MNEGGWELGVCAYSGIDSDEELGAVGVGPGVGHRDGVGTIVPEVLVELVNKVVAPDGLTTGAIALGISGLNHEALDHTVEEVAVVVAIFRVRREVFHGQRRELREQLDGDVSNSRVNGGHGPEDG